MAWMLHALEHHHNKDCPRVQLLILLLIVSTQSPPAAGREKGKSVRGTPPNPPAMGLRPPAPLAK